MYCITAVLPVDSGPTRLTTRLYGMPPPVIASSWGMPVGSQRMSSRGSVPRISAPLFRSLATSSPVCFLVAILPLHEHRHDQLTASAIDAEQRRLARPVALHRHDLVSELFEHRAQHIKVRRPFDPLAIRILL